MLIYETGKLPPSVDGWGLSDRADYLYFTTLTSLHACIPCRMHTHARKDRLFLHTHPRTVHASQSHTCGADMPQLHQVIVHFLMSYVLLNGIRSLHMSIFPPGL